METTTKLAFERLRRARLSRLVEVDVLDVDLALSASNDFGVPVEEPIKSKYHYVYVFRCRGAYKIGRSVDPEWRLRQLQTASVDPIELIHTIKTTQHGLERALHRQFSDVRQSGEWFALTDTHLDWIKEFGDSLTS